ncbi:hypothetical protein [Planctopirus hydrillae]|uniref:Uncharacterized protein n=1 Tax=Planctopirus hydrillae TaxID=1841610 RepID=A0A1C3E5X3_9PLAN|nr:hypothetical protein [Planctopirus hydrillae]ODA28603.1 hypothetical protein A6X21_13015 [Planctopirus hydrillae]
MDCPHLFSMLTIGLLILSGQLFSGCAGEGRYLTLMPRPVATERKASEIHDPYPEKYVAPDTFNRPRAFIAPRTDERQSFDLRSIQATVGQARPGSPFAEQPVPYQKPEATPQLVYEQRQFPGPDGAATMVARPDGGFPSSRAAMVAAPPVATTANGMAVDPF